jgi:hypothetical protein
MWFADNYCDLIRTNTGETRQATHFFPLYVNRVWLPSWAGDFVGYQVMSKKVEVETKITKRDP